MSLAYSLAYGLVELPWWGYVLVALGTTHITIAAVTIFLHRHQAHRALDLHPVVSHFFRFWLWLTTGMVTKAWAAIHRKHHAKCETADDPHSPQVLGIRKVLWQGAELYRAEAGNAETLERYGHGTPDDWIERTLYTPYSIAGIGLLLVTEVVLFGAVGLVIWAVQMAWIPFFAAGIINGVGHYWGYRNFASDDASRNIVPWGILIGGEELHNNHHAYATSARLSSRWFEFDIGWMYIRILEIMGLATVKKVVSPVRRDPGKTTVDLATLQAIIAHRYEVLANYASSVRNACAVEIEKLKGAEAKSFRRWLVTRPEALNPIERAKLQRLLDGSKVLETVYAMGHELSALWQRSTASKEQLVRQLEDWCRRADSSGIAALQNFSRELRAYA